MTQRTITWTAIGMLGLLGSTNAFALESGFYIGALAGQSETDIDQADFDASERDPLASIFNSSVDESDTGMGLFLGWQFGQWFALEAQYADLGEASYVADQTVVNFFTTAPRNVDLRSDIKSEVTAASLSGIVTVPMGNHFALGVRLGVAATKADISYGFSARRGSVVFFDESDSETRDNVSGVFGVNVEWDPTPHFGLRLEFQRYKDVAAEDEDEDFEEYEGYDVTLLSLSAIGRF